MINFYISDNKKELCAKIYGKNFCQIKECLKDHHFTFTDEDKCKIYQTMYWHGSILDAQNVLDDLKYIEALTIPEEIKKILTPEPETEYFRTAYDESLLKCPPLGEYQSRAIKKGISQSRCYFAHKQGLGKSYMVFGTLNHLWHNNLIDKVLILCRPEGVYTLKHELLKYNTIDLSDEDIYIVSSTNRDPFNSKAKVVISNYRSWLMICSDTYKKQTGKTLTIKMNLRTPPINLSDWGNNDRCLICDEAHSCKNRQSGQTKMTILESQYFNFRYLLSGTPYPKGIEELWAQFKILDENIIRKSYYGFLDEVAVLGTKFSQYGIRYYKDRAIQDVVKKLEPWMIREFAEDNIKLPKQLEETIYVEMTKKQRDIYQKFISYKFSHIMKNNKIEKVMKEVYKEFGRIQGAVTDPCLIRDKIDSIKDDSIIKSLDNWKFEDNTRVEICDSLVENCLEQGRKIIIWSGHPKTIQRLGEHYKKYNPVLIHGEIEREKNITRDEQLANIIEQFKKDDNCKLLIASYLMISTSQNIIEAGAMIYWDRPFAFDIMDQSLARNCRPTSKYETLLVYYLVANRTIEVKQDKTLKQRKRLDEDLMKYNSLSKDEWKALFNGEEIDELNKDEKVKEQRLL